MKIVIDKKFNLFQLFLKWYRTILITKNKQTMYISLTEMFYSEPNPICFVLNKVTFGILIIQTK